ncbi:host cell factor C1 regulator 1 [Eublepharis macularius]|uniref:Host cell factor C1 regulator 1 n=1 Tax=Eublepharis macularius TaxID=481883 RepID=A0AA97K3P1_EUBMA|nr:host cell factor C1 regulator 1 [Eublepharis macularius]XP_054848362.1 host cell factor C1 regulator 1 [Eublepharis macularius]
MDPANSQQPPAVLLSSHPSPCSILNRTVCWSQSRTSGWPPEVSHRMPWMRQNRVLVNSIGMQRPRCRPATLAFKRHLENTDQEPRSKHFLSEDKMAARFNSLSLDNDHMYSSNGFPVQEEDPKWQQAYTRLKELQRRLSQDSINEASSTEEENEDGDVVVDGEFIMPDCTQLMLPSVFQESLGGVSLEALLSLNPCSEVVLWSPPGNSVLHTIRMLMATPSSFGASTQPEQEVGVTQEEMEI